MLLHESCSDRRAGRGRSPFLESYERVQLATAIQAMTIQNDLERSMTWLRSEERSRSWP